MNTIVPMLTAGAPQDPEHTRIARLARIAWLLLVLSCPIFGLWLPYRVISCSSRVSQSWCEWGFLAPLAMGGLITVSLGIVLSTIVQYDRRLETSGRVSRLDDTGRKRLSHRVRRGYRHLHPRHQRYVRHSVLVFSMALGAFLGFAAFFLRLPALASMLIGLAAIVSATIFNRWATNPDPPLSI
jgi:hypothetical protein